MHFIWKVAAFGFSILFRSTEGQTYSKDPFCNYPLPSPLPVEVISPDIQVYTTTQSKNFTISSLDNVKAQVTDLDQKGFFAPGRQVVFTAHGGLNGNQLAQYFLNWPADLKTALFDAQEDSTVFIVNWGRGSDLPDYNTDSSNTQTVGKVIAALAEAIINTATFKGDPNNVFLWCIGHSLGVHVCGNAGRYSGHFDRTTGLDPAGPGFESCWSSLICINKNSGACVENIHTEGSGGHQGTIKPMGHIDFYPNGGKNQPGCYSAYDYPCSHLRAPQLFVASIKNKTAFSAYGPCTDSTNLPGSCSKDETQSLGYWSSCHKASSNQKPGLFYLTTGASAPYY